MSTLQGSDRPRVYLVGAGVVGRAILQAHLDAAVPVWIADQSEAAIVAALEPLWLANRGWRVSDPVPLAAGLMAVAIENRSAPPVAAGPIVIESIAERLEAKQSFFLKAERLFGADAILCSNTSTLRIAAIAEPLALPERFCGMHFFMPVYNRPAVELIRGGRTSPATMQVCGEHVQRIGKQPLVVGDGPGFIVNRLLSPYLNEALLLLGRGVPAEQIEHAALAYGMPMSPLELIDWIGTRTMFDAGRVYWQSFPGRLGPSAMLSALIKSGRLGRACGAGLYDYVGGVRSQQLAPATLEFCQRYRRDPMSLALSELVPLLSVPMWIEAAIAYREGIASSAEQFNLAMRGGLGYTADRTWLGFFDSLGSGAIVDAIARWSPLTACMRAPDGLVELLQRTSPMAALQQFART